MYITNYKKYLTLALSFCCINYAIADNVDNSADSDLFRDEGRLLFKGRLSAVMTNGKETGLPTPKNSNPKGLGKMVSSGMAGDLATTIFFTDNIASELSLGMYILNTKRTHLGDMAYNYLGSATNSKKKRLYGIPLTFTAQYHIAPFGGFSPYVGAGYQGSYLLNKSKDFRVKSSSGPVLQVGVDLIAKDDTFFNIDVKKYFMKIPVKYKGSVVNNASNISSKINLSPLIVSVGVGFKL